MSKQKRIYVPSGWKHYARDRKTLRRTFVSWGKTVVFFDRRKKKQFFQGKQMFFSEFFCARHNVFQPEGYIFLGFHPLTYHKPLHFDKFCFILPLQILLITWLSGRHPAEQPGILKGQSPFGHNVTTFKIMKKISPFLCCWQWTYSASSLLLVRKSL